MNKSNGLDSFDRCICRFNRLSRMKISLTKVLQIRSVDDNDVDLQQSSIYFEMKVQKHVPDASRCQWDSVVRLLSGCLSWMIFIIHIILSDNRVPRFFQISFLYSRTNFISPEYS